MRALHLLFCGLLMHASASAAAEPPRQLYELSTETQMPHLEENLRYANTREQRCLSQQELWSAFPVLRHPALKGCRFGEELRHDDSLSYELVCEGGNGATGRATWRLGSNPLRGALSVKLGGKNMTFHQRVSARPMGECA